MTDGLTEPADVEVVLLPEEVSGRKATLGRLADELAALGIDSVVAGRHVLRLNADGPWSPSGPVGPELHVLGTGCRCTVTTDGERYLFAGGAVRAGDAAGAAAHLVAAIGASAPAPASQDPGQSGRIMGAGEQALRQLIDDGLI